MCSQYIIKTLSSQNNDCTLLIKIRDIHNSKNFENQLLYILLNYFFFIIKVQLLFGLNRVFMFY